jgi:hypothetical protein
MTYARPNYEWVTGFVRRNQIHQGGDQPTRVSVTDPVLDELERMPYTESDVADLGFHQMQLVLRPRPVLAL